MKKTGKTKIEISLFGLIHIKSTKEYVIDENNRKSKMEMDKHSDRKTWVVTLFNTLSQIVFNIINIVTR